MRRLTLAAVLLLASPAAAQTGLTIYSDGRVLVRRTIPIAIPAGTSTQRLPLGLLEPGSVFPLDADLAVLGASYDAAIDEPNVMRRAVGRKLWFRTNNYRNNVQDTVEAEVLGVAPERFRLSNGQVTFMRPGLPIYPSELILVDQTLDLFLRAAAPLPSLRLGYFTSGAHWSASYDVILERTRARVAGKAIIPSTTLRIADAEVQLLAGNVGRGRPGLRLEEMVVLERAQAVAAPMTPAVEEQIGEVHLYTLPGKVSLESGVTTTTALFEPTTAPWERSYVVRGSLPWYGPLPQYGNEENSVPVEVRYALKRTPKTSFGDLPLPGGVFRLYEADAQGRPQLVGEATAPHTAAGQDVRLSAGTAFDLTAKRVQTSYSTQRDSLRTIAFVGYRVTVSNAKDSVVTVEVLEERAGEWSVISSTVPAEKLSSTRTRFRLRVPAQGQAVVTYRIRAVW